MNDYVSVRIDCNPATSDITDLLAADLAEIGFESFVPDDKGVTAYIPVTAYDPEGVRQALRDFPMHTEMKISSETIEGKDWNEEWEKHYFQPIVVGGEVVVHSSFHKDVPKARYDIVVDPKMAFGTGHHFTTRLMMQAILSIPVENLTVTDMGTGTGILAILCAMRGATRVTGVEIDPGAWENATENVSLNHVDIQMMCSDASILPTLPQADLFLANINRNIISADLQAYADNLKPGGLMLLSGFYTADAKILTLEAENYGLKYEATDSEADWALIRLRKLV